MNSGRSFEMLYHKLTQDADPVVEGDDEDVAVGGEDAGVPQVPRAPREGLPVHVDHDGKEMPAWRAVRFRRSRRFGLWNRWKQSGAIS